MDGSGTLYSLSFANHTIRHNYQHPVGSSTWSATRSVGNSPSDVASNPALRDMFTSLEAAKQLEPFLRGMHLTGAEYGAGEIVAIDLTGPFDALSHFHSKVLSAEDPAVYWLSYR